MLILKVYRIMVAPSGIKRILVVKVIHKWTNEEAQEFDFDIFDELQWKKYLREDFRLANGKKLPQNTVDGEQTGYEVYFWGTPIWVKEHFVKDGLNDGFVSLYPGYLDGVKRPVQDYGDIYKKWR